VQLRKHYVARHAAKERDTTREPEPVNCAWARASMYRLCGCVCVLCMCACVHVCVRLRTRIHAHTHTHPYTATQQPLQARRHRPCCLFPGCIPSGPIPPGAQAATSYLQLQCCDILTTRAPPLQNATLPSRPRPYQVRTRLRASPKTRQTVSRTPRYGHCSKQVSLSRSLSQAPSTPEINMPNPGRCARSLPGERIRVLSV